MLKFNRGLAKESSLSFSIVEKEFNTESFFDFLMRYWPSYTNKLDSSSPFWNFHNSGAYDFRTIDNLWESLAYSELVDTKIQKGTFMQKMTFYFEKFDKKANEMGMKAILHVTIDQDLDVIKFDLDLNSLPKMFTSGYEFVATFEAKDFDNNQTFYTDSNGLAMQQRILNHRSFYNFTEHWTDGNHPLHNQNISGNYYPVTSAIALKDGGSRQFTVSNDRA